MRSVITAGTFRANPSYELVLLDDLGLAERTMLAELGENELYGVLRPHAGCRLEARSASTDTALLFLTLARPAPLPAYVGAQLGGELERTITRLVLDGVLELEHDGAFVSGPRAGELLLHGRSGGGRGRIGELTVDALRYGQELAAMAPALLGLRLYLYGRRPVTPTLARRLPDRSSVARLLGIDDGGAARAALAAGWREVGSAESESAYWLTWRSRTSSRNGTDGSGSGYKLYVSPSLDAIGPALATVAGSLARARGVSAFKVGIDLHGICRPDKLVVYFDRLDDLLQGAETLRERLDGCPAHGVPFSAAVTHDGLLSWGADPPPNPAEGARALSWRLWVSERLGELLADARQSGCGELEPWQFALERLRLSGVDTDTWVPADGMWPEALANV